MPQVGLRWTQLYRTQEFSSGISAPHRKGDSSNSEPLSEILKSTARPQITARASVRCCILNGCKVGEVSVLVTRAGLFVEADVSSGSSFTDIAVLEGAESGACRDYILFASGARASTFRTVGATACDTKCDGQGDRSKKGQGPTFEVHIFDLSSIGQWRLDMEKVSA